MSESRIFIDKNKRVCLNRFNDQVILHDRNLWFTQLQLAAYFCKNVRTINEHIKVVERLSIGRRLRLQIHNKEGGRTLFRRIWHHNLEAVVAIGFRSREYDRTNLLIREASKHVIIPGISRVVPVKERVFREMLKTTFEGVFSFVPHYRVLTYFIDFYCKELNLAIEYDENHHQKTTHTRSDLLRESCIKQAIPEIRFIRCC